MAFKAHIDNSTGNQPGTISPIETAILSEGVQNLLRGDFLVSGKASLAVDVAKGEAFVLNDNYVYGSMDQRIFAAASSATETVSLTSNSSGNPRIDIICLKIDTAASPGVQGVGSVSLVAVAGTPAASPSAPAVPTNHLKLAEVAVANGATTTTGQVTDTRIQASTGMITGPEGFLINGQIVRTVASNNLTVSIKTLAGNDPSEGDPVWCRVGSRVVKITASLGGALNAGTNYLNLGDDELATLEHDIFTYIAWDVSNAAPRLLISRIPWAKLYSDFNASATNEKGVCRPTGTPSSTDEVANIGRFNAILSAGAGYTWSLAATSSVVNRPIFETRDLKYNAQIVSGWSTLTTNVCRYKITDTQITVTGVVEGTSTATSAVVTVPMTSKSIPNMEWGSANIYATDNSGVQTAATKNSIATNSASLTFVKDMGIGTTTWTASGTKQIRFSNSYLV